MENSILPCEFGQKKLAQKRQELDSICLKIDPFDCIDLFKFF